MEIHKPDLILRFLVRVIGIILSVPLGIIAQGLKTHQRIKTGQAEWVEIIPVEIFIERLDPAFDGFRIAHLSDFHMGTWLTKELLDDAVELVNRHQPDVVAITGDFVTSDPQRYLPDLAEPLRKLKPVDGAYAVLGNHDHWSDPDVVREIIKQSGVTDLSNDVHELSRGDAGILISGIDDYVNQQDDIQQVINKLPADQPCILLAHEPDFADISAQSGLFDLQLSGHSHGGQIRLPLVGAPILPRYARKYPIGLYKIMNMILYTNRGLGMAELPVRWNCPPEITIITLRSPKTPQN